MFKPIETSGQLPAVGVANETSVLDFKVKVDPNERLEPAKDVAAFANAQGGTILVGAAGQGEFVSKYLPLSLGDASATQKAFEEGVRDRCRPAPVLTVVPLDVGAGKVVAINIWPFVGQPVGVELKQPDLVRQLQGVFFYPVRVGAQTRPILPEQMHMFVDAKFRRMVLALSGSVGFPVTLVGRDTSADWFGRGEVLSVDASANAVELMLELPPHRKRIALPIDVVDAVWRDQNGWKIRIPGNIRPVDWLPSANDIYKREELVFMEVSPGVRSHGDREQRVRVTHLPERSSLFSEALNSLRRRLRR